MGQGCSSGEMAGQGQGWEGAEVPILSLLSSAPSRLHLSPSLHQKHLSSSSCSPGAIPGCACPVHCASPSLKDNSHGSIGNHWCNICDIYVCSICKSLSSKWLETWRILWKSYMLALFLYSFLGSSLLTTVRKENAGLDELMI